MNAQVFAQGAMAFVIGMTGINILISFLQLCLEERKKCSIMKDGSQTVRRPFFTGDRKKYVATGIERRYA